MNSTFRVSIALGLLSGMPAFGQQPSVPIAVEQGRAAMRRMLERTKAPGASVAVAVRGKVVWREGFGLSDVEGKVAASEKTRLGIGSITKSLTTALMGRLADKGLLDLDAPVENYLPDWPHRGKGITTRLIAAHLSGLDDRFASDLMFTEKHYSTSEALAEIVKEPLRSPPLAASFYGTGTYTVIAAVVEKVTGKPFAAALSEHVLDPLRLRDTIPNDPRSSTPNRTRFYRMDAAGRLERAPYFDPSHKLAGAGYLSTAADLARFGSALVGPGFLKAETLAGMFANMKNAKGEETGLGLGWRPMKDAKGRTMYVQPGGGPGISGVVAILPNEGITVAVLTNLTGAGVGIAAQEVAEAFLAAKH